VGRYRVLVAVAHLEEITSTTAIAKIREKKKKERKNEGAGT
jgi:hypothetical protein